MNAYYEFDMGRIRSRLTYLRSLLGEDIALAYAVKANTFLIGDMIGMVERFEICSPGESAICDQLGVAPEQTVISGVYKTPGFIEALVAQTEGRIYTVESMTQFELLRNLSEKYKKTLTVLLRLTNDSQFGINESEIVDIIAHRGDYPFLDIHGIQFFSGTQKTSLKKHRRELSMLDDLLDRILVWKNERNRLIHALLNFFNFGADMLDVCKGHAQYILHQRAFGHIRQLGNVADATALGNKDRTFVGSQFACHDAQQRGFSRAVAAQQTNAFAGVYLKGDVVQNNAVLLKGFFNSGYNDLGHKVLACDGIINLLYHGFALVANAAA